MALLTTASGWRARAVVAALLITVAPGASLDASPTPAMPLSSLEPLVSVRLLDPGREPRQLLRYELEADTSSHMTVEMDLAMQVFLDGVVVADTVVPTLRLDAAIDVGEVSADGTARYEFRFVDARIVGGSETDAAIAAEMSAQLSQLVGLSGWAVVDSQGRTIEGDLEAPVGLDPTVAASLDQMGDSLTDASAPLPDDPVGIGARWVVDQRVPDQGVDVLQTGTYTLERIEGDTIGLSVEIVQTAEPGAVVTAPGLELGAVVTLQELTGTGEGTMSIVLHDLVPESQVTLSTSTILDVEGLAVETQTIADMRVGLSEPLPDSSSQPSTPTISDDPGSDLDY